MFLAGIAFAVTAMQFGLVGVVRVPEPVRASLHLMQVLLVPFEFAVLMLSSTLMWCCVRFLSRSSAQLAGVLAVAAIAAFAPVGFTMWVAGGDAGWSSLTIFGWPGVSLVYVIPLMATAVQLLRRRLLTWLQTLGFTSLVFAIGFTLFVVAGLLTGAETD